MNTRRHNWRMWLCVLCASGMVACTPAGRAQAWTQSLSRNEAVALAAKIVGTGAAGSSDARNVSGDCVSLVDACERMQWWDAGIPVGAPVPVGEEVWRVRLGLHGEQSGSLSAQSLADLGCRLVAGMGITALEVYLRASDGALLLARAIRPGTTPATQVEPQVNAAILFMRDHIGEELAYAPGDAPPVSLCNAINVAARAWSVPCTAAWIDAVCVTRVTRLSHSHRAWVLWFQDQDPWPPILWRKAERTGSAETPGSGGACEIVRHVVNADTGDSDGSVAFGYPARRGRRASNASSQPLDFTPLNKEP